VGGAVRKSRWERLVKCSACKGVGASYDVILDDFTIQCANCAGEGAICGECQKDVEFCNGEGICWEDDPNAEWSQLDE